MPSPWLPAATLGDAKAMYRPLSSSDLTVRRLPGAFAGDAMPARCRMLALRWRKEAVIEVRTCQTTIAILPPRGYFPHDVSSVETRRFEAERRPGLSAWV